MINGKPVIGLSSSYEENNGNPRIFIYHSYLDSLRHFGAVPLLLPVEADAAELKSLVSLCDGILLTGGDDVDPKCYHEKSINQSIVTEPGRDEAESWILDAAVQKEMPILGICRGIQMLNVYFGGSLYQDLPTQMPSSEIEHSMKPPMHRTSHELYCQKDTPLFALGGNHFAVNSHHHQAVKEIAPCLAPMAYAEDEVIEAIYHPEYRFIWGVQWHPERIWDISPVSAAVFKAFVAACSEKTR